MDAWSSGSEESHFSNKWPVYCIDSEYHSDLKVGSPSKHTRTSVNDRLLVICTSTRVFTEPQDHASMIRQETTFNCKYVLQRVCLFYNNQITNNNKALW